MGFGMSGESLRLSVHVYIEVDSLPDALEQAGKLCRLLGEIGFSMECHVERYWKIPTYYSITLPLTVSDAATSVEQAKRLLGERWATSRTEELLSAVWDYRLHGNFALPLARWCELQLDHGG
ncbi:hypothetical protein E5F05_07810 [Deinococcus metallilatus]|uniref:Uncharacterized protein n=1 Tax=Deinococcus metallilatus TaxID=1211322 RepID=A0AAJ5F0Y5_9DEIO|nr:hypothetical protein [Deinococcus metallilatus]MBB5296999.1 hypothetical protein [Deinococcus metallilatus]QBY07865.1 hypothetical protein E5F05_07810 [Deinococcus metallilatus]RXJ13214.1 hypothetical protein ERJ73_06635 [Deinococcus metallilatus]TLK23013.1 hypothetical protein FCS05_16680 [Deinococcus metallilatus]GMA15965.1 hypothetical protein GCM10025871_22960 [Deinococcus metallilatus]